MRSNNNNKLKAYVRFDGSGRIVPSSLIVQAFKPAVGNWQEIDAKECCNYTTTTTTTSEPTTTTTTTSGTGPTINVNYSDISCDTSGEFQTVTLMDGTSICDTDVYLSGNFSMLPTQFYITYEDVSRLFEKDETNLFAYPQELGCAGCA